MHRFVVALVFTAVPALCLAQDKATTEGTQVKRTVAADHAGTVTITALLGTVRVLGWDRDSVQVTGLVSRNTMLDDSLIVSRTPERGVRVRTMVSEMFGGVARSAAGSPLSGGAAELVVSVPAHSHVIVEGHQTAIDVSGVLGKLELSANVAGAMRVSGTPAELDAYVAGSDMVLDVTTTYLRARTASGRITWTGSSDDVSLNTVTGLITAKATSVGRGRFESTSGDIRFTGGLSRTASVTMDTHGGDIVAVFAKGTEAEVIANAAISDTFGVHSVGSADAAKRGGMVHHLGKNDGATVQLNSFKGRVSASIVP